MLVCAVVNILNIIQKTEESVQQSVRFILNMYIIVQWNKTYLQLEWQE